MHALHHSLCLADGLLIGVASALALTCVACSEAGSSDPGVVPSGSTSADANAGPARGGGPSSTDTAQEPSSGPQQDQERNDSQPSGGSGEAETSGSAAGGATGQGVDASDEGMSGGADAVSAGGGIDAGGDKSAEPAGGTSGAAVPDTNASGSGGLNTSGAGGAAGASSVGGQGGAEMSAPSADEGRSPGCGTTLMRPDRSAQQTMDVEGATRYYLLDVPPDADNETPLMLIFALHGYDMNNVSIVNLYNFTARSDGRAITVYPQGEGPPPGDTPHWGDGVLESRWEGNAANFSFMQMLITDLEARFCIDPGRVYMTGFSMGGLFTNAIACEHSDWFRGFAPVEGVGDSCANADAKPAMMIHQGTADTLVTTDRGEATRDFWAAQNGCTQTTTQAFSGCDSFEGCDEPVVYCLGTWDHTIDATATANIWSFFEGLE
jgi:polyhydroxybutyrate depolymerase